MSVHATTASSTKKTSSSGSSSMLHLGSSGSKVLALQKLLKAAGFNPHGLDGKFGPMTLQALRSFQAAARIVVDGKAGPQTFGALKNWFSGNKTTGTKPTTPTAPTTGGAPSGKVASMLNWAKSMIGTKYAAVNPFRFGNVLWDGKPHTSVNGSGKVYNFPKGTRVFDCSGFVVAAYRQLGVDLASKGLASTATFHANANGFLQNVSRANLKPGDLVMYKPHNGIGHVVIYMGNGRVIESRGGAGVITSQLDESRIKSIRRVPL